MANVVIDGAELDSNTQAEKQLISYLLLADETKSVTSTGGGAPSRAIRWPREVNGPSQSRGDWRYVAEHFQDDVSTEELALRSLLQDVLVERHGDGAKDHQGSDFAFDCSVPSNGQTWSSWAAEMLQSCAERLSA